ncbi:winged helix-turn-helix domain-containing protein [Saccharibacillus sp. CPCC 101409]|uniref:ArsR/SmtB family transcription factor n=1 Tax=Saccharibacillus sp. CPCC 101409 TaxID=3058041 RepID=UPI002672C441|nr:winged helix-turn-helix domain-containing protein [Saccharibacillus sp. CPCC 101409]MDO3413069.1 winged helix-turn-helix domain-containing protein [Saccharibacillus sp. CPCC 101409]
MYEADVEFQPLYELMNSLHTYLCRKFYKKIDLSPSWAAGVKQRLTPEFAQLLDASLLDRDWKAAYLLAYLSPNPKTPQRFIAWLDATEAETIYRKASAYTLDLPEDFEGLIRRVRHMVAEWNEQYFRHAEPQILGALGEHAAREARQGRGEDKQAFVERLTHGLRFEPVEGLERVLLIPQYHFQPVNVIYHYGRLTLCHYASGIHFGAEELLDHGTYRVLRSLGEHNRLKILKYLNEGPRTFIEIFRYLGLSKGITHDHISNLRRAGLTRAHFEGETLTVYSLRTPSIERLSEDLLAYIGSD